MSQKSKEIAGLAVGYAGALGGLCLSLFAVIPALMKLPTLPRLLPFFLSYWFIAVVPLIVMRVQKDRFSDYGFTRAHLGRQILTGVVIALIFLAIFVLPPYLIGQGEWYDDGKRYGTDLWRYGYELFYDLFAVAAAEEFVFRGFGMTKLERITGNRWAAAALSAVMFGLFHYFAGGIVQVMLTAVLGFCFAACKVKVKHCVLPALIIAHGLYDFVIAAAASLTHL